MHLKKYVRGQNDYVLTKLPYSNWTGLSGSVHSVTLYLFWIIWIQLLAWKTCILNFIMQKLRLLPCQTLRIITWCSQHPRTLGSALFLPVIHWIFMDTSINFIQFFASIFKSSFTWAYFSLERFLDQKIASNTQLKLAELTNETENQFQKLETAKETHTAVVPSEASALFASLNADDD